MGKENGTANTADLKLSEETRDEYLKLIKQLKTSVRMIVQPLVGLGWAKFGNVGELPSANRTRENLEIDIATFRKTLNQYRDFLDEFEEVVKASADRLLESG